MTAGPRRYLRDIVADMPAFRHRIRQLPLRPTGRCSHATAEMLPPTSRPSAEVGPFFGAVRPIGSIEFWFDASVPTGQIEIDGTLVAVEDVVAAARDGGE